jgi:toxin ParE1/3/4
MKPVMVQGARDHDCEEVPHMVSEFATEVDAALLTLQKQPKIGSSRWGLATKMTGLRTWPLTQFPNMVFYFDRSKHIEVVRILHQSSDIPQH